VKLRLARKVNRSHATAKVLTSQFLYIIQEKYIYIYIYIYIYARNSLEKFIYALQLIVISVSTRELF